jgi:hypothetical protein
VQTLAKQLLEHAAGEVVRALAWLSPIKAGEAIRMLRAKLPPSELEEVASARARLPTWIAREVSALVSDFGSRAPQ